MIDKLEVGKTYVFVSEEAKQDYLNSWEKGCYLYEKFYNDGFTIERLERGGGYIGIATIISKEYYDLFKLKDEEPKKMKPEDKVTIEISLGELAKIYAAMHKTTGSGCILSTYKYAATVLDPDRSKIKLFDYTIKKIFGEKVNYHLMQKDWEELLFGPQETEQQKKVRELREKAQALLDEADELEKK